MESKKVELLSSILKIRDESKPNIEEKFVESKKKMSSVTVRCIANRNNKFIELISLQIHNFNPNSQF